MSDINEERVKKEYAGILRIQREFEKFTKKIIKEPDIDEMDRDRILSELDSFRNFMARNLNTLNHIWSINLDEWFEDAEGAFPTNSVSNLKESSFWEHIEKQKVWKKEREEEGLRRAELLAPIKPDIPDIVKNKNDSNIEYHLSDDTYPITIYRYGTRDPGAMPFRGTKEQAYNYLKREGDIDV